MIVPSNREQKHKFILSGGGTGGHIFPAIAIANALKNRFPDSEFLFVGALGKMEMEKVPKEGFEIVGLPIEGLRRSASPRNLLLIIKTLYSFVLARKILKKFKPSAVIGTGGYASLPICFMATMAKIPTILQEQNGYAGLSNRILANKASMICTGFPDMQTFFTKGNWLFTGNPVRENIRAIGLITNPFLETEKRTDTAMGSSTIDSGKQNEVTEIVDDAQKALMQEEKVSAIKKKAIAVAGARSKFGLDPNLPVLFVTGGSLGAFSINEALFANMVFLAESGIQLIWQMGQAYAKSHTQAIAEIIENQATLFVHKTSSHIFYAPFIVEMDQAYLAADIVISRAGALSIAEIAVVGIPAIFVPSPNVTDDHQTKNAMELVNRHAALCVSDDAAAEQLIATAISLLKDSEKQSSIKHALLRIAKPLATQTIATIIEECLKKKV
ncbi:MAG: undecaprenyldiphospho-muramoylpentapeptide beta-N-acetylglucosaminyltransferase [Flavobacteriales bacterium]|nr:MAG: undecaprenyldiphospho-muramoylpentapeptide beta-N-acetylglucosaminyltransferase [Flavobacteriales bacterium]